MSEGSTSPEAGTVASPPVGALGLDVERQVLLAQASIPLRHARTSNLIKPPVGLLMAWMLWPWADHVSLVVWYVALCGIGVWREALYQCMVRDEPGQALQWSHRHDVALAADGFVYGLVGTWLLPRDNLGISMAMLSTVMVVASIGLVLLFTNWRSVVAFTVPMVLPAVVGQLALGTRVGTYFGVGMAILLLLILQEGRQASEHTRAMLRLRFQMNDLALQRQQALDLAQRHSEGKSLFLATMSHEMRTPLHGILGIARLLRSADPPLDPAIRSHRLELLERTGEHLLALINDVLDYSRIESGHHVRLEPVPTDLMALAESVVDLTRVTAMEKGLTISLEATIDVPCWAQADGPRLRQMLLNLVGNAVKFTEQGGVTLVVRREADGVTHFDVIDSGPGIAADQRNAIFEAFHQVDGSPGRRHGGTGLGLTISREIARAAGGDLVCTAAAPRGSKFTLSLPLASAAAPPEAPAVAATVDAPSLEGRVLVAEDNPVNAIVAEAMLQRAGLEVDLVSDGQEAVEQLEHERYDLVLMDCQMPVMDGFEATARIRERESRLGVGSVPIIALTANALAGDRQRSIAAGMTDHLAKPFQERELDAVLRRFLQVRRESPAPQTVGR